MHILIIGNGIAGITAARTIRKLSGHTITVISAESDYFFARTALMYVFMGHIREKDLHPYESWFWGKNKITLVKDYVITLESKKKSVITASGKIISYDKLIIASGSQSDKLNIPGETLDGVGSLYSLQDLNYMENHSHDIQMAVIAGGGLIGIEMAEMLHSRGIPVTMVVRESSYSNLILPEEESQIINQQIRKHGIKLLLNTELTEIKGDNHGHVKSVLISTGEEIECRFVGISVGVIPNISWLKNSGIETNKGILVDEFLQTNFNDVYAIGDCAEVRTPSPGRRAIEPVWYTGRIMGETVAQTLCGFPKKYEPGSWFNSAKFFNTEYQVYGDITPVLPEHQATLFWLHKDGDKSIRINYTQDGVIGFQVMGIRLRQVVCEKWIHTATQIEDVLASLELALFDPEFSMNYASSVRDVFRMMTGIAIRPKARRNLDQVQTFLKKLIVPFV